MLLLSLLSIVDFVEPALRILLRNRVNKLLFSFFNAPSTELDVDDESGVEESPEALLFFFQKKTKIIES